MKTGRIRARGAVLALLAVGLLGGCATTGPDPWEGPNRAIFAFNEGVDRYVLEPVAVGWDFVMPQRVQWGVSNFFDNLEMPVVFVNDLLQLKPVAAAQDVGRFLVNTTLGLAGLIDVASRLDIPSHNEDFGQTLGRWGMPPGPYMVLPLFGPSTVRDTAAIPVDIVSRPQWWLVEGWILAAANGVDLVNTRSRLIDEIRENRRIAFDYYAFVRNAYLANRERNVRDGQAAPPESQDDDLYMLEDDLEEDLEDEEPEGPGEPEPGAEGDEEGATAP